MRRKKPLPARSMFAECGDIRATATWALRGNSWFCESASHHLKWMKRMTSFDQAKAGLSARGFTWSWIPASTYGNLQPPF